MNEYRPKYSISYDSEKNEFILLINYFLKRENVLKGLGSKLYFIEKKLSLEKKRIVIPEKYYEVLQRKMYPVIKSIEDDIKKDRPWFKIYQAKLVLFTVMAIKNGYSVSAKLTGWLNA